MKNDSRESYRTWTIRFFLLFFSMLAIVAGFNFFLDSVGVFHFNKDIPFAVSSLLEGKLVAGYLGLADQRKLQTSLIENYQGRRDVIVLGSSRGMTLRKSFLGTDLDFYNHSMTGAVLKDFVAIIGAYWTQHRLPKTVIISLDPWLFNKKNGYLEAWKVIGSYYDSMMNDMKGDKEGAPILGEISFWGKKSAALINLENTLQNWKTLRYGKLYSSDALIRTVPSVDIDDYVREPDGSIHLPYALRHAHKVEVKGNDKVSARGLEDYENFSDQDLFKKLIVFLQHQGTEVVFLISPFHPALYRRCREDPQYGIALKAEAYLRKFAMEHDIRIFGSLDPDRYGFTGADFFDWTHGHENVMQKIMQGYRQDKKSSNPTL